MIDHIGFPVSDYERSKKFYTSALAALGYTLIMEVDQQESAHRAAGFGRAGKPDFWIGGEGGVERPLHVAFAADDRAMVDAFYRAARAAGGADNGAPDCDRIIIQAITAPSSAIRMGTTSKRCAIAPPDILLPAAGRQLLLSEA